MHGIKYFSKNLNIKDKTIILRADFNVPIESKEIKDSTRILSVIPFLEELIKKESKIIIISHLGRPKGKKKNELSLLPIFKILKEKIKIPIYFYTGEIDREAKKKCSYLKSGEIMLLENIRFFEEESMNDENFSKRLAELGDIYINNAFSCSHRKEASIHNITKFMKECFAGPLIEKELSAINLLIKDKKEPVTCIVGGSKISTKINILSNLIKNIDNIIVVGAMANNFIYYKGFEIGKSMVERDSKEIIKKIYLEAKKYRCNIIIPEDFLVSKNYDGEASSKNIDMVEKDEIILDIGPKTIQAINNKIDDSNTVMWNGPAGYFENKNFAIGTNSIAKKISKNTSEKSLISILGGGDTISAINNSKLSLSFTHLSTAGGAFLEYLEGKDLPGLSVLK